MKIWAHRGCSQTCPENTMTAFERAVRLKGLTGIELDIQLTRDGELVVIHDERIDRTTDGFGFVRDYTLKELRTFHIHTGEERAERIPTIDEVFDLLEEPFRRGFRLNIELKNSIYPYPGMEEKILKLVHERGIGKNIVFSSFYARSLTILHALDPEAECGILDTKISDCLYKAKGLGFVQALHPFWRGMDLEAKELSAELAVLQNVIPDIEPSELSAEIAALQDSGPGANHETNFPVRAWLTGHLYPEKPTGGRLDLASLKAQGITDLFLNEPEAYLGSLSDP